jgi:hypothetical protein
LRRAHEEGVKMRKSIMLISLIAITLVVLSYSSIAYAFWWGGWTQNNYYYELSDDYPGPNIEIPLDTTVTVTAKTDDGRVDKIKFIWDNPGLGPLDIETKPVQSQTVNGETYYYATTTRTLSLLGDWKLTVKFIDAANNECFTFDRTIQCRHTHFNVIPEIPVIGTAGVSIAMLAGLTYKLKRKPKSK